MSHYDSRTLSIIYVDVVKIYILPNQLQMLNLILGTNVPGIEQATRFVGAHRRTRSTGVIRVCRLVCDTILFAIGYRRYSRSEDVLIFRSSNGQYCHRAVGRFSYTAHQIVVKCFLYIWSTWYILDHVLVRVGLQPPEPESVYQQQGENVLEWCNKVSRFGQRKYYSNF